MNSVSADNLKAFKAIADFVTCLGDAYGDKFKSLQLYCHLIKKTTLMHKKPILKHITAFKEFCIKNRTNIEAKNAENLVKKQIIYSLKVFIDMPKIFAVADKGEQRLIWQHLVNISFILDPAGTAKKALNKGGKENEFLTNIINKVEANVDPEADPLKAVSDIMQSGVFTELVGSMGSGLENGELDLNKLLGSVQSMVTTFSDSEGEQEGPDVIKNMMGAIAAGAQSQDSSEPPDMSNIMNMIGPMMQNLQNNNGGVLSIDEQVQKAKEDGVI